MGALDMALSGGSSHVLPHIPPHPELVPLALRKTRTAHLVGFNVLVTQQTHLGALFLGTLLATDFTSVRKWMCLNAFEGKWLEEP